MHTLPSKANFRPFQAVFFEPVVKVGLSRVVATGDKLLRGAIGQQAFDLGSIRIEFLLMIALFFALLVGLYAGLIGSWGF
jgi:hypothetical protein